MASGGINFTPGGGDFSAWFALALRPARSAGVLVSRFFDWQWERRLLAYERRLLSELDRRVRSDLGLGSGNPLDESTRELWETD